MQRCRSVAQLLPPQEKTQKILLDVRNIAALPLPRAIKSQLIGAKVIPQCCFAAHLSKIPKVALDKTQAEITQALWGNRPQWRAKHLVLGLLSQPHRVDPYIARFYCAILDFIRYINHEPVAFNRCRRLACSTNLGKFSLIENVRTAFSAFGFTLTNDLCIEHSGRINICLSHVAVRDLVPLLKHFAVQTHYSHPANLNRKDFFKPEGFIDLVHSKLFGAP